MNNNFFSIKRHRLLPTEYASFRSEIVEYFVSEILPGAKIIFDPMAGTSPLIPYVEYFGLEAYFNDLLPIHFYVNRAKTYEVFKSINSIISKDSRFLEAELVKALRKLKNKRLIVSEKWIHDDILAGLIEAWQQSNKYDQNINFFFKAVIILCVRPYSSVSPSLKNQLWNKPGGMSSDKTTNDIVKEQIGKVLFYYKNTYENFDKVKGGKCTFLIEDASTIRLQKKPDVILTSPAYANRNDYTIMYAPELYFLNKADNQTELENLKKNILATNTVDNYTNLEDDLEIISKKAPMTFAFLMEIYNKGLKKENNYYQRYYCEYYANLYRILDNMVKLLNNNMGLYVVVQNNIHRGEVNLMGDFLMEYFDRCGLKTQIVLKKLRHHQGKRNISANHPLVLKKHEERIIKVKK